MSAPEGGQTQNVEDTVEEAPAAPIPRSLMDYNISIPARDRRSNYLSLGKRDQILKKYENPKANFSDIKEANWYGDRYAGDDYKSHKWALGKDVDEPGFGSGVDDLARILLDAKKDVKFNKNLSTRDGALYWVEKKNKANPNNKPWSVSVTDINGDKIPEIIIADGNGNIKYVNGWHLTESKTPLRAAHQSYIETKFGFPNQIAQKRKLGQIAEGDMSIKNWIYQNTSVNKDAPYGPLIVKPELEQAGYKSRGLNTCNLFMKFVTKPLYQSIISEIAKQFDNYDFTKHLKSAASIISINAKLYTKYVSGPVYNALRAANYSDKQMKKKLPNSNYSIYSQKCAEMIQSISSNQSVLDQISSEIREFIMISANKIPTDYEHKRNPLLDADEFYDRRDSYKKFSAADYLK